MTPRRKKVQKVLEIREQDLNAKAGVLTQAHKDRNVAASQALDTATHLATATEYRKSLTFQPIDVLSWIDAEQWLARKIDQNTRAQMNLENAELLVMHAHKNVVEAHSDVKRMELLDKRLANGEAKQQSRFEQTSNDDHARRRYLHVRRGDAE